MNLHENPYTVSFVQYFLLRSLTLFIVLLSIPFQADFYSSLLQLSWSYLLIDLYNLVTYLPHFWAETSTLADWLLFLSLSLVLAYVWGRKQLFIPYEKLFYYLRVFSRYKLASILFVAGFLKVFPIYVAELSLSHLNTGYGYFTHWKHLLLSLSVAPAYLVFLGVVEVLAAVLLLFRKTSFLAILFVIPFYGNIFLADLAYEGGNYLFPVYVVLLSLPIFSYDLSRLSSLIVHRVPTNPAGYTYNWSISKLRYFRITAKVGFSVVFIGLVGYQSFASYRTGKSFYYPEQAGLPNIAGKYWVVDFVLNGDTIAASPTEKRRWKDVVFEKWNTLSIRVNDTIALATDISHQWQKQDSLRNYEYTQVGDRLYYSYVADPKAAHIALKNRNTNYKQDTYAFNIRRTDASHISLAGKNGFGDTLQVELVRAEKKYLLEEVKKTGREQLGFQL